MSWKENFYQILWTLLTNDNGDDNDNDNDDDNVDDIWIWHVNICSHQIIVSSIHNSPSVVFTLVSFFYLMNDQHID